MLVGTASIADRRLLVVTTVLSACSAPVARRGGVAPESTWAFGMSGHLPAVEQARSTTCGRVAPRRLIRSARPPPLRLGIEESEGDTKTWLGFSEPEHLVPVASEVEQAALTPDDVGGMLAGVPDAEGMEPAPRDDRRDRVGGAAAAGGKAGDAAAETTEAKTPRCPELRDSPSHSPRPSPRPNPKQSPKKDQSRIRIQCRSRVLKTQRRAMKPWRKRSAKWRRTSLTLPRRRSRSPLPGQSRPLKPTAEPAAPAPALNHRRSLNPCRRLSRIADTGKRRAERAWPGQRRGRHLDRQRAMAPLRALARVSLAGYAATRSRRRLRGSGPSSTGGKPLAVQGLEVRTVGTSRLRCV